MKTQSMHDPFQAEGAQSSHPTEELSSEMLRERLQEEKQPVHEKWWLLALFAAIIPIGLTLSVALTPLGDLMKADTRWSPPITDEDLALLDGAMTAPSIIVPVLVGVALDAAWSVNLGLLICLIGSVFGEFLVALGIAWHSFGLALTGRVVCGFCFGSIFVVADTIAAQFNRKRRATTFGLIGAVQAIALSLNATWLNTFTIESLDSDYEKTNDVLLIVSLLCLGVGFLWSPIVSSYELVDSAKRRFWKWHVPLSVWALVAASIVASMYHSVPWELSTMGYEMGAVVILSPLLGYYMDKTEKSQAGSLTVTRYLVAATSLVLLGHVLCRLVGPTTGSAVASVGLGVMPMLVRSAIPQVASRDNLSTSFGLVEGSVFVGGILVAATELTFLRALVWLIVDLALFVYVMYKVSDKWEQLRVAHRAGGRGGKVEEGGRFGELSEPLHPRGA